MKTAAAIASEFRIDPITVLNANRFEWMVRMAAYSVVADEKRKEAAKAKRKH